MNTTKEQNHPDDTHADKRGEFRIEQENANPENRRNGTDDITQVPTVLVPIDDITKGHHHNGKNRRQRKKFKNK